MTNKFLELRNFFDYVESLRNLTPKEKQKIQKIITKSCQIGYNCGVKYVESNN